MNDPNASSQITENVQDLEREIRQLSTSDPCRNDLDDYLQDFLKANVTAITISDASNNDSESKFDTKFQQLMQFSSATVKVLQTVGGVPSPLGTVCKIVAGTVGLLFSTDVGSSLIKRFDDKLDADLKAKCRASCTKISHCIAYMQGIPDPKDLSKFQKDKFLLLMASDIPVQTGLDEVLHLGEKIKCMVDAADVGKFECLMNFVELYCCLATFRELFLLYRFAVQSLLDVDAKAVQKVLESQFLCDSSVLEFLHRPTTHSAKLYYKWRQRTCPLSRAFCERRRLMVEHLNCFNKGVYRITSAENGLPLSTYDGRYLSGAGKPVDRVFLEFGRRKNNVFSIQTADLKFVGMRDGSSYLNVSEERVKWKFVKIHGTSSSVKPCFMIWLDSDATKCMHMYQRALFTATTLTTTPELGPRYFWNIEPFQE